ncbi:ankyrin repeat domain-containing protein 13D isoform X1 [Tachysurus vachellii]|uniref:ankyrin repeat domain-containing protein 13D isoform X1 n=2 Tax=Tachysurus vachellii TaxID=175792 RepID=UPI00296AD53F|nr:ankyrin repeat domain-containing protein 13D isoform X1 [Tachysurus vachellii]XP_060741874.1 ankyrin repeat domain-containing protein 13D isoform X1 [Tachysurus vachellii]XP_060741875.1 ankyrin repeat domain-containing protein 13D isoform X1 [Tachysurus vachellii]
MAQEVFPLHYLVWNNRYLELDKELKKKQQDMECVDPRGRTPLELAVCLGHVESMRVLLRHNADPTRCSTRGWTVLQEAVSTGDPELVQLVLQYRDFRRATERLAGIPELLSKLRQARDFYVEMKWEFTSWVPLVSKVCPSDVYRVWKSGSCLRVDTTLLGFEHMTWLKGRRSYIFKGGDLDGGATVMEVDHEKQVVYTEPLSLSPRDAPSLLAAMLPSQENTAQRLTSPIVSTHLNTRNIAFERNKSGIWGWRSEKTEVVSGYEAKVYSASNVELVTRSRTEHLSDQDKSRCKGSRTPLQSFLGIAEQHVSNNGSQVSQCASPHNPTAITAEEYFDPEFNLNGRDIGRPIELTSKVQRFKATLWLSEAHPLSLAEQVTPIIDLMAISNAHFAKLRDFIALRLPPGFPVKIEIPLFHVLNARVTFSNLCGCDEPVSSVTVHSLQGATDAGQSPHPLHCEVDPSVFEPPADYTMLGPGRNEPLRDEDDNLLQFAIQQSLLDAGTESDQVTIWEALTNTRPMSSQPPLYEEDSQLERCVAIQESLSLSLAGGESGEAPAQSPPGSSPDPALNSPPSYNSLADPRVTGAFAVATSFDEQLRLAMELSCREQEEQDRKRREEEEELERIIQLSLTEK